MPPECGVPGATAMPRRQGADDGLRETNWICLRLLCWGHAHKSRVPRELHVLYFIERAMSTSPVTSGFRKRGKVCVTAADERKFGRFLPRATEGALVDIQIHHVTASQNTT